MRRPAISGHVVDNVWCERDMPAQVMHLSSAIAMSAKTGMLHDLQKNAGLLRGAITTLSDIWLSHPTAPSSEKPSCSAHELDHIITSVNAIPNDLGSIEIRRAVHDAIIAILPMRHGTDGVQHTRPDLLHQRIAQRPLDHRLIADPMAAVWHDPASRCAYGASHEPLAWLRQDDDRTVRCGRRLRMPWGSAGDPGRSIFVIRDAWHMSPHTVAAMRTWSTDAMVAWWSCGHAQNTTGPAIEAALGYRKSLPIQERLDRLETLLSVCAPALGNTIAHMGPPRTDPPEDHLRWFLHLSIHGSEDLGSCGGERIAGLAGFHTNRNDLGCIGDPKHDRHAGWRNLLIAVCRTRPAWRSTLGAIGLHLVMHGHAGGPIIMSACSEA